MFLVGASSAVQKGSGQLNETDAVGPAFEVATIRPANRDDDRRWFGSKLDAGRFQVSAESLSSLVSMAYSSGATARIKVMTNRGAPAWVTSDQFDIQAKVDDVDMNG